ncbi:hypothetical protein, partial [Paenibacillus dendritiformis]|uniref:hypothetical protein n=1 Tax=Paenibacillus dendritiformis TaxID=130049 RepID=UPI001C27D314
GFSNSLPKCRNLSPAEREQPKKAAAVQFFARNGPEPSDNGENSCILSQFHKSFRSKRLDQAKMADSFF